jgi:TPR repeat protein
MTIHDDEQHAARALEAGNYEEAARILRSLAERNSQYALLSLGWIYETGAIGDLDKERARLYYERAAAEGSASACLYLGRLLLGNGEDKEARVAFEAGAKLDNDECKYELEKLADRDAEQRAAQALEAGSYEEATRILRPLAERNSQYALLSLGWIYETGAIGD